MPTAFRDVAPEYTGATFVPLILSSWSGRSVVLVADRVYHNVYESVPDLAGTGTASSARFQEWVSGEVGLGIFQIPHSTRLCLWRSQCLDNPPWDSVVEFMYLANILPVDLLVEVKLQTLRDRASPTLNMVSRDASSPPWGFLVVWLASLGGELLLGRVVILLFYSLPLLLFIKTI